MHWLCGIVVVGANVPDGSGFLTQCVLPAHHTGEHQDTLGRKFYYKPTNGLGVA